MNDENQSTDTVSNDETVLVEPSQKPIRKRKKLSEFSGSAKRLRIFAFILAFAIMTACVGWSIWVLMHGNWHSRFGPTVLIFIVCLIPILAEYVFKMNLSNFVLIFYYTYVLFSGFVGSALGTWTYLSFMHYDKIMHGLFGYVGCVAGLFVLVKLGDYDKIRPATAIIFIFSVSMMTAALWEFYEFFCDRFFGADAQGQDVINGYPLVKDTMGDIIAHLIGATLFTVQNVIHRASGKNFLIASMVKDFRN